MYKVTPEDWGKVKAIAGCSSDGVPGVSGVGESTACKYLTKMLPKTYKTYKTIEKSTELINFNKQLVILPFKGTPDLVVKNKNKLSLEKFITISQRYGFDSFLKKENLDQWKTYLFPQTSLFS